MKVGNIRKAIGYRNDYSSDIARADLIKLEGEIARLRNIEGAAIGVALSYQDGEVDSCRMYELRKALDQ